MNGIVYKRLLANVVIFFGSYRKYFHYFFDFYYYPFDYLKINTF